MMLSCSLAKSSFASEFSWFCPGEAIKNVLFKCLHFCMSIFFFFWCKESHEVNDPKAELCSEDAKDEILTPPALPTLLWHVSSSWGCWARHVLQMFGWFGGEGIPLPFWSCLQILKESKRWRKQLCSTVLGASRESVGAVYGDFVPSRNAQVAITPGFGLCCASRGV